MGDSADPFLYKVASSEDWQQVLSDGTFRGFGIDLEDGFIHLSTGDQIKETVRRYFAGRADLMLIVIDGGGLGQTLRWEPSRGGDLFPHVYGTIPMSAVQQAEPLPLGENGEHCFSF